MTRIPKVTAAVDPLGRLCPQRVTIRYQIKGVDLAARIGNGYSWRGHVAALQAVGATVIEVQGHRGKRTWRLYPEKKGSKHG